MKVPEHEIYKPLQTILKVYPDHARLFTFDPAIFIRKPDFEPDFAFMGSSKSKTSISAAEADIRSIRRSKTLISDYVLCNTFDLFCTFTFNSQRQDIDFCKKRMSKWLHNVRDNHGVFEYLIVPEFHKDGKSIHFHALMRDLPVPLINSGHKIKGRTAYNLPSYKNGFTTAVKIDDQHKVSSYVKKYIVKDMPYFAGKKRFWTSKGLQKPEKIHDPTPDLLSTLDIHELYRNDSLVVSHCIFKESAPTDVLAH